MKESEEIKRLSARRRRYGLRKEERLSSRTLVSRLFEKGKSFSVYPLRCVYLCSQREELESAFRSFMPEKVAGVQMMVTVPKKKRRHAVDRVLMRRRIKEAWRLNRLALEEAVEGRDDIFTLSVALVYMADRNHSYRKIESRMNGILERILQEINEVKS